MEPLGLEEAGEASYCLMGAESAKMKGWGASGEGCTTLDAFTATMPHFTWAMSLVVWGCAGSGPGSWLNPGPT